MLAVYGSCHRYLIQEIGVLSLNSSRGPYKEAERVRLIIS